jgi:toxin CcdB
MAQFDVFRNSRSRMYPLVMDVQAELLAQLATRVVVPLMPVGRSGAKPMTRLNPTARLRGKEYSLIFQEIAAIPKSELGAPVASLAARRAELIAAIDLLFTGI